MKLVVGMLVKNEAERYLAKVIQNIASFADEIVILDDFSSDDTIQVIKDSSGQVPVYIAQPTAGDFGHEIVLRKQLYQLVLDRQPDWFMIVDADEIYASQENLRLLFERLMTNPSVDVYGFRLYDMWSETEYRDDALWRAHEFHSLMLVRNIPEFVPQWREADHHCGRLPINLWSLRTAGTDDIRIQHYGWAKEEDRKQKYDRYMKYDPEGAYGSLDQYQSILDPAPNLQKWV